MISVNNPLSSPTFAHQLINVGDIDQGSIPDAPQLGSAVAIETNNSPRAMQSVWRNDKLYLVNTINPSSGANAGQATVHWYSIDTSNLGVLSLLDQGNVDGEDIATNTHTFFPSIAVNSSDGIAIGFAASGAGIYPGAYVTGRTPADTAGTVQTSAEIAGGLASYVRAFSSNGGTRNRWGDYSGTSVDPSNDSTFWAFNEYALAQGTDLGSTFGGESELGRWGTKWGSFYSHCIEQCTCRNRKDSQCVGRRDAHDCGRRLWLHRSAG